MTSPLQGEDHRFESGRVHYPFSFCWESVGRFRFDLRPIVGPQISCFHLGFLPFRLEGGTGTNDDFDVLVAWGHGSDFPGRRALPEHGQGSFLTPLHFIFTLGSSSFVEAIRRAPKRPFQFLLSPSVQTEAAPAPIPDNQESPPSRNRPPVPPHPSRPCK